MFVCCLVDENTSFTKQEKLLLKFDSILAALGVCDQVSLKNQNRQKIKFLQGFVPFNNIPQASIDKIFRHLSQHSELSLEEEGKPTVDAEKR